MNDDELGDQLFGAFDAHARASVPDDALPPPPRFTADGARPQHRSRLHSARLLAPLAAAATVVALVAVLITFIHGSGSGGHSVAAPRSGARRNHLTTPAHAAGAPVRVRLLNTDGARVGVGMPVIAYFSRKITDGRALQAATTVTVDGRPADGAWYFEQSTAYKGYPYEAHLRLRSFWPADSQVHVGAPIRGLSAGHGLRYTDDLNLDFRTGNRNIATVSEARNEMTVRSNGRKVAVFPVSLGAPSTPTLSGTKVIMQKGANICMTGPGYNECGIRYTQRLTYTGEYLHSAPWNERNIVRGVDSSNGCTNLLPADAKHLYRMLEVGDIVRFPYTDGSPMRLSEGYGDWNVSWKHWLTGGLVPVR